MKNGLSSEMAACAVLLSKGYCFQWLEYAKN